MQSAIGRSEDRSDREAEIFEEFEAIVEAKLKTDSKFGVELAKVCRRYLPSSKRREV